MKVVILAAGMGTRLADTIPKPLIPLKDENTILDYQISGITRYVSINDIYVVAGYKKELLMEKYPRLIYVYNHGYAQTNTGKSLLYALCKIDDDVIWMNGDVYFDKNVVGMLMKGKVSSMLVENKRCGYEEIKYTVDKRGYIREVSKEVQNGLGEAVGINLVKKKDVKILVRHLEQIGMKDYFEKAIENMIRKDKVKVKPVGIKKFFCKEIDFPEDLKLVREHLETKKTSIRR